MTVEEIEIIVTAKVEEALKEFNKIVPTVQKKMKEVQESFSKVDTQKIKNQMQNAIEFVKRKIQNLKKSSESNKIAITVTNEDAQKQITQIEKEIDSLQKKITGRQLKLDVTNNALDKIRSDTNQSVIKEMPEAGNKQIKKETYNRLDNNANYQNLVKQSDKLNSEIERYNVLLNGAKIKMGELEQQTSQTATSQSKLASFFGGFKQKVDQVKPKMSNIKSSFKDLPKITQNITNNIKNMGSGLKNGLGHVIKYAAALFSLRGIYSILSNSAQSWLSSQNAGAKQLSANIEYMKYAMGSALAPVIQFVTNLVYQLMRAIQSVAYALTGVNIFAKATASSMKSASSSAKQANNSLSSVHSEINNVSDNQNGGSGSGTPNIDLSKMENTPSSIIDAIKNGNWYEVGETIGQKINDAMNSIPWDKIQSIAKKIGTNIAQFLNGGIKAINWNQVGNTFAQGINTAIYFAYNFVTTFDWKQFGKAIGDSINGFFNNIDWATAGKTLGDGIKGVFSTIYTAIEAIVWQQLAKDTEEFVLNIDWNGVTQAFFRGIGSAFGGLEAFIGQLEYDLLYKIGEYFQGWIDRAKELGGNIVNGILMGILYGIGAIATWINDNIFEPFVDGFKNAFGIHSPSTVMIEMGGYIIDGLKIGLLGIWDKVKQPFIDFKNNLINKFAEIKSNISDWTENTKTTISNWGNDVKSKISSAWNNASQNVNSSVNSLKNNISTGLNNAKTTVANWGDDIKNTFSNLGRNASTWGKDLADNMASGIKNNIHKVTSAVSSVANKIKDYLHFTEPDVGPLSNFHTYMPDMIDLMVKGIKDNTSKVKNEIENLAGTMSYTIDTSGIGNSIQTNAKIEPVRVQSQNFSETLEDILASQGNNGHPVHVTIQYLGKDIFDDTIEYINSKTRRTGKNTIVTVGD